MKKLRWVTLALLAVASLLLLGRGLYYHLQEQYLQRKYPLAYTEEIARYAAEYRLNPYMVLAVVRSESTFRPDAVSGAGAIGLMQIMPSTGAWIAEEMGQAESYNERALYAPETNIAFGCWYLRYLANLFDGDFMKIICAYNAGQGSVAKWLDDPAYAAEGRLIQIPFPETARYYENVLSAYTHYMRMYPALFSAGGEVVAAGDGCYNTVSEDVFCWK